MKIQVFISHSHRDKIFVELATKVFKEVLFSKLDNKEIRFTSSFDNTILTGQDNIQLFHDLRTTRIFIFFLSDNYRTSEFCLLENGGAFFRYLSRNSNIIFFPILDESITYKDALPNAPNLQHAAIDKIETLESLFDLCLSRGLNLCAKSEYLDALNKFKSTYRNLKKGARRATQRDLLFENIVRSFSVDSNIDAPITLFANRHFYERFSITTSKLQSDEILWTLYKSPLLVQDAYGASDFLTEYDRAFRDCSTLNKKRLVIFEDFQMAKDYHQLDFKRIKARSSSRLTNGKIRDRKLRFEEANEGCLFFTTKKNLNNWYKSQNQKKINRYFDYEFGFVTQDARSKTANFGFTSGFHSNTFHKDYRDKVYQHVILFPANMNGELLSSFERQDSRELTQYFDIPIQQEIVEAIQDISSKLCKDYLVEGPLNDTKLGKLR